MVLTPQMLKIPQKAEDCIPLEMRTKKESHPVEVTVPQAKKKLRYNEAFRDFVSTKIVQRVCSAYLSDGKNSLNETKCGCGRTLVWHHENGVNSFPDPNTKWTPNLHSKAVPCTSFGEIEFSAFGKKHLEVAPYARVDKHTPPAVLWELLHDIWQLPAPKLVISVTGGAKKFYMKNRLRNAFKQGLMEIATSTDAWIITGGTGAGVMKYVGEALHEYDLSTGGVQQRRTVAIGIASWGFIDNHETLEAPDDHDLFPALYSLRDITKVKVPLDHNHTHFILVDDGSEGKFAVEIALRAKLESYIAKQCQIDGADMQNSVHTPVVLIVLEGGPQTLQQSRDAIASDTPLVIIKGSGRAADVIAIAYQLTRPKQSYKSTDVSDFSASFDSDMTAYVATAFNKDSDVPEMQEYIKQLRFILKHRNLITIFEMDDSNCRDLDRAVLKALLKAKPNPQSQVELALVWNRADIAKQHIFTMENQRQWQTIDLEDTMHNALFQGSEDFVQLFLENGVQLGRFLTIRRLRDIYLESLNRNTTMSYIVRHILSIAKFYDRVVTCSCSKVSPEESDSILLHRIGEIIQFLLNDKFDHPYLGEDFIVETHPKQSVIQQLKNSAPLRIPSTKNTKQDFKHPETHLFLWALLFNKHSLARLFWKSCRNPIGGALVGSKILKSLSLAAARQEEIDLSIQLQTEANYYEEMACGVITVCYQMNKEMSRKLLRRELKTWGRTTLFSLAESAELMDFMQLSCCQTMLNRLWYGKMVDHTDDWKIMLCICIPPLVTFLKFKSATHELEEPTGEWTEALPEAPVEENSDKSPLEERWSVAFGCLMPKKHKPNRIGFFKALYQFNTAPVTKFYVNLLFYLLFLLVFTVVVLVKLTPIRELGWSTIFEFIVWTWACAHWCEEIRQIGKREAKTLPFKLLNHLKGFWNQLDFLMFVLFTTTVVLRYVDDGSRTYQARITYAITLMLAYLRVMEAFYVSKMIGPKIIMIQKMLKDLVFFVAILAVFIASFGIAMQSLLHPARDFSPRLFIDAVYIPYWQIFGELFIERAEGRIEESCESNSTLAAFSNLPTCPQQNFLVPLLSAVYMMLTNVLLMNLLIAMFSYTFQTVQDNSEKVWRFYRYSLVYTYFDAPTLPPPFVIFTHIKRIIFFVYRKCNNTYRSNVGFKVVLDPEDNARLAAFEKAGMHKFLAQKYKFSVEAMESRVALAGQRLDEVVEDLEEIKEQLLLGQEDYDDRTPNTSIQTRQNKSDGRIGIVEEKINQQSELLRQLLKILRDKATQ